MRIRTSEGQQGNIQILIVASEDAGCQNLEVPLKPLNLHQKIIEIDDTIKKKLILNTIKF